ncbi:MAG TPA: hypothetical protein VK603_12945 [Candidatus Saccharimonadales bacterium]|nr:hypothetical protein [Candidatus Saccharimonadales bacterium]
MGQKKQKEGSQANGLLPLVTQDVIEGFCAANLIPVTERWFTMEGSAQGPSCRSFMRN